jgi:hypothetical protein
MTAYTDLIKSEFHDTSLVGISRDGATLILKIEYYDDDDNEQSADVSIAGVGTILREGTPIHSLTMETDHGSIVVLGQHNQDVKLLLDWVDFSAKSRTMGYYEILGATIQAQPERN